ncbi:MAG: ThuA domain-containing protein [Verrucomicrobiales bacterium]|nr:ThuA domain-containing protein [Verrucomicrobiales bacterium]
MAQDDGKKSGAKQPAAAKAKNAKGKGKKGKGLPKKELYSGEHIKALIITGGCCHNYIFQTYALGSGVGELANVEFQVVNMGGRGTAAKIDLYNNPNWADGFDVVIHNECFAKTTDPEYIRKITEAHRAGVPAVVVHCAMHTYRDAEVDDWREFLGVTSKKHEHKSEYPVKITAPDHPVMKKIPTDWVTPTDELYIIEKLWPNAKALATSVSENTGKEHPVIWVNDFKGTRVAGTTYGHSDETFRDPVFIRMLANAIIWTAGKDEG